MRDKLTIVEWITYSESRGKEENGLGGMGGWFENGMRWKDYKNSYKKIAHSMLETLRKSIIENGIKCSGEAHQGYSSAVPLWSNGKVDTYSFRAWGDLMAAVWSTEDNQDYNYMSFYM